MGLLSSAAPIGEALKLANTILGPLLNRNKREASPAEPRDFGADLRTQMRAAELSAKRTLEAHDTNHDGALSAAEIGLDAESFARIDANADGRINRTELTRAYAAKTYQAVG